ncbi:MAG: shikimate dehydrogenase, partial [Desulfofustis sp.]|nr:shikimate dehydrogenase [Desulfofustis sp.]
MKSPATFGDYFMSHGINAVMVPLHVGEKDFLTVLGGLRAVKNFAGAIVTIPHKYQAYQAAHTRGAMALRTGTANVLAPIGKDRWSAEMLDGVGLVQALRKRGISIRGLRTLLIGAGGAGTAIAVALEQLGQVASISIAEPDGTRARHLLAKLERAELGGADPAGYQLVVNASPVGMGSDESPVDASRIAAG